MTTKTFSRMIEILEANYRFFKFDQAASDMWFNSLARFDDDDVKEAVTDFMIKNADDHALNIASLVHSCERTRDVRLAAEKAEKDKLPIGSDLACRRCMDRGYTLQSHINGSEVLIPCPCAAGREAYPYLFMSKHERIQLVKEQAKNGKSAPSPYDDTPTEWKKKYYAGEIFPIIDWEEPGRSYKWKKQKLMEGNHG